MECLKCAVRLRIRNVYLAGRAGKTQTAECPKCGRRYTLVTVMLCESDERGSGAYAKAKQLEKALGQDEQLGDALFNRPE